MPDLKVIPVIINLDKPRNLIFDLNMCENLEIIYDNLDAAFKALTKETKKVKHLKNFLWAGLVHEDETLTPDKVGTLISYPRMNEMTAKIWEAIDKNSPTASEDDTKRGE